MTSPPTTPWVDTESPELARVLRSEGVRVDLVPWDAQIDWSAYVAAVVRSPWDLYGRVDEFLAWLRRASAATTVLNPAGVIGWNLDKRYLLELDRAGVAVTPTVVVEPGEAASLPHGDFVIKPVTSGGARLTARYQPGQAVEAKAHVAMLHQRGLAALVQPYLDTIDTEGERVLVFIDGEYCHAVRKGAALKRGEHYDAERDSHPSPALHQPSPAEFGLAAKALAAVPGPGPLLYARVDMATGPTGSPVLMELELVDPLLFLQFAPTTLGRLASAIVSRQRRAVSAGTF